MEVSEAMEVSAAAPPQFSRQNSAAFNASVNDFLHDLGSAGIGEAPANGAPQSSTAGEIPRVPQESVCTNL